MYINSDPIFDSNEYLAINRFYGKRTAKRSGVSLMNHIHEAFIIFDVMDSKNKDLLKLAFCLHPLVQNDKDLVKNFEQQLYFPNWRTVALAMEYRRVANNYLSHHKLPETGIELSPMWEVNEMLKADKIQNFKDFCIYHAGTHPNSDRLFEYFQEWFTALNIDDKLYNKCLEAIKDYYETQTQDKR